MNKAEIHCLKVIASEDFPDGILTSEEIDNIVFNRFGLLGDKTRHQLVIKGCLNEVAGTDGEGLPANFYRITEKGLVATQSLPKRFWYSVRGDVKSVIVSVITAFLVTLLTLFLTGMFSN